MSKKLHWTGERLETYIFNESTIEHLHRYGIAMELVANKKVLDIACGEGYGSSLLAAKALHVTGMDIDASAIESATAKYKKENLSFIISNAEKISAPDSTFDIVVSFETLEHLQHQEAMITEIKRVLRPDGILLISTPDKKNYTDNRNYKNPYHLKELYRNEFEALLKSTFRHIRIYDQQMAYASYINTLDITGLDIYTGNYTAIEKNKKSNPLYLIAIASDKELPHLSNSLFSGNSIVEQALTEREEMVTRTITYRLGHFILFPFKLIRKLFKK